MNARKQRPRYVTVTGLVPPKCNHARQNLFVLSTSLSCYDDGYVLLECRKCCVRKQYRLTRSGNYRLLRTVAIRKVST